MPRDMKAAILLGLVSPIAAALVQAQVAHEIVEKAFDGTHRITDATRRVDANSDIVVVFNAVTNAAAGEATVRWRIVSNFLANVRVDMARRAELMKQFQSSAGDPAKEQKVSAEIGEFNKAVNARLQQGREQLGLDDTAWRDVLSGRFDGQVNITRPYVNLARWLSRELESLNREAASFLRSREVEVSVQAFLNAIGQSRKALHVDNYDRIPSGEYQPIDRTGLRMTPAEQSQLALEIQLSESAARSIREIQKSGDEVFKSLIGQLKTALRELTRMLDDPALWDLKLDEELLRKAPENLRPQADKVMQNLKPIKDALQHARALVFQAQRLQLAATDGNRPASLSELVLGTNGIMSQLTTLLQNADQLLRSLPDLRERLTALPGDLKPLEDQVPELRNIFVPAPLQRLVVTLEKGLPNTLDTLRQFRTLLSDQDDAVIGSEILANTDLEPIWRAKAELVPATLELTRAGLVPGDRVLVRVLQRDKTTNGASGAPVSTDYKFDTVLMGFHRKIDATLMFARGLQGDDEAREWKPNVAATVHWHYRYRDETGCRKWWNGINPGIGFHLASLDQGDENIEFGLGANLSLFDGLLSGGFGYNLSNEDPYVYVGINLLETLNKAKQVKNR